MKKKFVLGCLFSLVVGSMFVGCNSYSTITNE